MTLNPLSNPKGVKLVCELCQKPAFVQCTECRVTYYCSADHQKADWLGIHEKICQLLIPLRQPVPFLPSEEDRQKYRIQILSQQRQMIDLTRTTGQKLLFEGRHEEAVPAAMQSLKFAIEVFGLTSIELVPSYLILGEASIGLGRLSQAEEYLSQASWTVLKTPECSNGIRSKLFRNLGLLYAAKGDYEDALRSLADDVYHASLEYGTDDIRTSGGYFHMANVFFRQNNMETADSLYSQVTDIWMDHLSKLVSSKVHAPETPEGIGLVRAEIAPPEEEGLDEAQEAEARQVLGAIFDMREQQGAKEPLAKAAYSMGMLNCLLQDIGRARDYARKALSVCEGLNDEELTKSVREFLGACERML